MILRNIHLAWRNIQRDRLFSTLNILGLSAGITCALLIYLWVKDEESVDKFLKNDDRLFQVIKTANNGDGTIDTHESTPGIMAMTMKADLPEVEQSVSVVKEREKGIIKGNNKSVKAQAYYAGDEFFDIFSYSLIDGNREGALKDEKAVLVSEMVAIALFNTTTNLVGKTIQWNTGDEMSGLYSIAGVFKSPPANASDQFDILLSYNHYYKTFADRYGLNTWHSNNPYTYLILKEGVNPKIFNEKIKDYSRRKMLAAEGPENLKWEGDMFIQQYSDKYLFNEYENGKIAGGRIEYVRIFTLIGILIIILACINFMNLATARASSRIKDAGIRKLIGANRIHLIFGFIGESIFLAFLSAGIAVVLAILLLPAFEQIIGKKLQFTFDVQSIAVIACISLVSGIFAGSYPAIYLSSFKPARVLKNSIDLTGGHAAFRKGLVVFQFALSIVFIIAVLVVYEQMKLVQQKNLGFDKNNIISFTSEGITKNNMQAFLDQLRKVPGVASATGMDGDMIGQHSGGGGIHWEGKGDKAIEFDGFYVNVGWPETFRIPIKEGRTFESIGDSNSVLFNETAVRMMGLNDPVGKKVSMWGREKYIVGIVKDFHYESLYRKPGPLFISHERGNGTIIAKVEGNIKETTERIGAFYKKHNNGLAFEYKFIDEDFQKLYASEQRVSVLSRYFAALAILISCLGLFGLSAFTVQKRQKEIGVRKVLGATGRQIAFMLSGNTLKLILLSILIAFPIAWWILNEWLLNFEYRISISVFTFGIAGVMILLITLGTISFQSIKAALTKPVKILRAE
jgi:ABC-type antimicrobial peptide transport system permease subunit